MTITVLGATGATGRLIVEQLQRRQESVRAVVRNAKKTGLDTTRVELATLDLATPNDDLFNTAFSGAHTVINAAATGSMSKRQAQKIDQEGVIAAINAAASLGVKRWIQVSMVGSGDTSRLPGYLRATGDAKHAADTHLRQSGMAWTVIRPPWLTNGPATGRVTADSRVDEGASLSRADLAEVAVACLDIDTTVNGMFEVSAGGRTIGEALRQLHL
jgi:uncharacterized protein YbjT (DUF2867 family)